MYNLLKVQKMQLFIFTYSTALYLQVASFSDCFQKQNEGLRQRMDTWFNRVMGPEFPFPTSTLEQEEDGLHGAKVAALSNTTGFFRLQQVLQTLANHSLSLVLYNLI